MKSHFDYEVPSMPYIFTLRVFRVNFDQDLEPELDHSYIFVIPRLSFKRGDFTTCIDNTKNTDGD